MISFNNFYEAINTVLDKHGPVALKTRLWIAIQNSITN